MWRLWIQLFSVSSSKTTMNASLQQTDNAILVQSMSSILGFPNWHQINLNPSKDLSNVSQRVYNMWNSLDAEQNISFAFLNKTKIYRERRKDGRRWIDKLWLKRTERVCQEAQIRWAKMVSACQALKHNTCIFCRTMSKEYLTLPLVFWTFDFVYVISFLFHRAFAFLIFGQECRVCPCGGAATNVESVRWKCSHLVHATYLLASTGRFLAWNPRPRFSRCSFAKCHHWVGEGLLSSPGKKKEKKGDRREHCHRPKRFVFDSMWILDREDTSIFIHAVTAVKFNFDSTKAGDGVTVINILVIGILLFNLSTNSHLLILFRTMSHIYTITCDYIFFINRTFLWEPNLIMQLRKETKQ